MLDVSQVTEIGAKVAHDYLPPGSVVDVTSCEREGPDGEDIFKVLVVLRAEDLPRVTGEQYANVIYQLQVRLMAQGDDRFAVLSWATDEDLAREAAELAEEEAAERAEEADGDP